MHCRRLRILPVPLVCLALLAGCGAPAPAGRNPAEVRGAGAPGSVVPETKVDWCGLDLTGRDQRRLFLDRLARFLDGRTAEEAVAGRGLFGGEPDCLRWEQAPGKQAVLVGKGPGAWFAAVRTGRSWRVSDLWGLPADSLRVLEVSPGGGEMLVEEGMSGSGGNGGLIVLRLRADGTVEVSFSTRWYEQVKFERLRPGLVLATYRGDPGGPVAWQANCCLPVAHQTLWEWRGERLVALGERRMADPYLTASRFFGELARGDDTAAAAWSADPSLVAQVRKALGPGLEGPIPAWYPEGPTSAPVRRIEERNWSLLPDAFRRDLPPAMQQYTMLMRNGERSARLRMKRLPEGWRVAGISLP